MPLIINQGKQDTSNDVSEPIKESNVTVVVEKIELNKFITGNLNVYLKLMTGKHKGAVKKDLIPYLATDKFSWKYRAIRNCAGEPYKKNEPENIDIEKILKDKVLVADFSINEKGYQIITYKKPTKANYDEAFSVDEESNETIEDVETTPVSLPIDNSNNSTTAPITADNDDEEWED